MKGFVMSGLRTFSCVVVLCGAMANVAIAGPKIEARGELGRFWGGSCWWSCGWLGWQISWWFCGERVWSGNRR